MEKLKPKQASQISINDRRLMERKHKEVDEILEMEKKRMQWFEYFCVADLAPKH